MNRAERQRRIVIVTIELVAAAMILGVTLAVAISRTATGDPTGAIIAGLVAALTVWLLNRITGALFAELGVG